TAINDAVGTMKTSSVWQGLTTDLQAATTSQSLTALRSKLNCNEVYDSWQEVQLQVCGGLVTSYAAAGLGWTAVGVLGFLGALGQYMLWRRLRDNRSLWFDSNPDSKPRGCRKLFACFLACAIGDGEDVGGAGGDNEPAEGGKRGCCRRRPKGDDAPAAAPGKAKKGPTTSIAPQRISDRFFEAFDMSIEEGVKSFLEQELYSTFDPVFSSVAVADRVAAWKALEKEKKAQGDKEVYAPGDEPMNPNSILSDYGERGPDGVPIKDLDGKPLDTKALAKLKKDLDLVRKPWDQWQEDKRKYDAYLLSQVRNSCLSVDSTVEWTADVEHLRPLSPTSKTPMVVTVTYVPDDLSRAVWLDETEDQDATVV
ncbi:unnamed protein product, partial [Polarella glacialis]